MKLGRDSGLGLAGLLSYYLWQITKKSPETSLALSTLNDDQERKIVLNKHSTFENTAAFFKGVAGMCFRYYPRLILRNYNISTIFILPCEGEGLFCCVGGCCWYLLDWCVRLSIFIASYGVFHVFYTFM